MRNLLIFLLLILTARVIAGKNEALVIQQVNEKVFVYVTYQPYDGISFPSNSVYVLTSAGAVLIDTPWDTSQTQPLLDAIQRRHHVPVIACIATHFHDDRTAGLEQLRQRGIPTWTSEMTRELCRKEGNAEAAFTFLNDTTFVFGDTQLETFYPGKGHAPDNIVVWIDKYKILIGGCFVKSVESETLGNLSDADVQAWPESVRKTMKRYPVRNFVIPGHFKWLSEDALNYTLTLLENQKK